WPLVREKIIVDDVVHSVLGAVTHKARVTVAGIETLPPIEADAGQIRQVFMNLVENAGFATGANGEVWIRGRLDGRFVEIAVEDSGPGVDVETLRRLFEPLITTKAKGIGLGLA